MTSHDSIYTGMVCPTAMVFTPCRDGISHSPLEYASPEKLVYRSEDIHRAILKYDNILRKEYEE